MITKIKPEGGKGYKKLKEKKSLDEILETAIGFEQTARDFYTDLCDRVSKPLRGLVQELADEEAQHYNMFMMLRERSDIHQYIDEQIKIPPSDHQFSDYVHLPDLGESPSDQDVLLYALGREQAAMEQYSALAKDVPPGPIADLFQFLAHEELEHKKELEKTYYEMIHSGGV
jgi:rubrerythrin